MVDGGEDRARALELAERGEWGAAVPLLEAALERRPDDVPVLMARAHAAALSGDRDAALRCYDAVLAEAPGSVAALVGRGNVRLEEGDLDAARDDLDRAVELAPGDHRTLTARGHAAVVCGRPDEAIADLETAVAASPPEDHAAAIELAAARAACGELEAALELLDRVVRAEAAPASAWYDRGRVLKARERYHAAITSFEEAVRRAPDVALHRYGLADALGHVSRVTEALEQCDRAAELDSGLAEVYPLRAFMRWAADDLAGARADYDTAIAHDDREADLFYSRGLVRKQAGDHDGAREDYFRWRELLDDV